MNGRNIRLGIEWILLNIVGALAGALISYGIAWLIVVTAMSLIGLLGAIAGMFLAILTGGIIIAFVVGKVQRAFLRQHFDYTRSSGWWFRLTVPGWILAGLSIMPMDVFPLTSDFSPLVWVVIRGACIAGGLQWLFSHRQLQHATRLILSGSLATIIGACLAVALIGGREPFIPFLSLLLHQETIHEVNVDNLMTFDSQISFTVAIEKGYTQDGHRWELWRSNGTTANTEPIEVGHTFSWENAAVQTRIIQDRIFLYGDARAEPSPGSRRSAVWQSDGTSTGTSPIDIPALKYHFRPTNFERMARLDQRLIFVSHHGGNECHVQITTGTPAGTEVLADLKYDCIQPIMVMNERAVFIHHDLSTDECQIWGSDGTPDGTRMLTRFAPFSRGICIRNPQVVAGQMLFLRPLATGHELWASDGTRAETKLVTTIDPTQPGEPAAPAIDLDQAYIFTVSAENKEGNPACSLWHSDGSAAGTRMITQHCPDAFQQVNDAIVFTVREAGSQKDLWVSDGSSAGTYLLKENVGTADLSLTAHVLTATADLFFFQTKHDESCEIWRSDGTVAGTTRTDLPCTNQMVGLDGTLFLLTRENEVLFNLWQSDGTGTDMRMIRQVP